MEKIYDLTIIGGGVIGCTIARSICTKRKLNVLLIDKESSLGVHASTHNSGVIHSGFYYEPNSNKAKFSVAGSKLIISYCKKNNISFKQNGSLILANNENEVQTLESLKINGEKNGVIGLRLIDHDEIHDFEPYAKGISGLYSPHNAVIDVQSFLNNIVNEMLSANVEIKLSYFVKKIEEKNDFIVLQTNRGEILTKYVINCAGVNADVIGSYMGVSNDLQIIPFRGEYYELSKNKNTLVNSMIYPVPSKSTPFLGTHVTKTVDGNILFGPNSVIALGRESYSNYEINPKDLFNMLKYIGFWKMLNNTRNIQFFNYFPPFKKSIFYSDICNLVHNVNKSDMMKSYSGVRAQLVDSDGNFIKDILIRTTPRSIHVLNAVSPGLTCSLAFADYIDKIFEKICSF